MTIREPLIYSHMAATAAWRQSPGYDLRRTRRDLPDLARNAAHGGINQRFLRIYYGLGKGKWHEAVHGSATFLCGIFGYARKAGTTKIDKT